MRTLLTGILFFSLLSPLAAQKLDFLGLKNIYFGMASSEMPDKTVILDTSSSYHDTLTYLRNTRCQVYFRRTQDLRLTGFTASRIEYEFCDSHLHYVFIYVDGNAEIDKAINTLKQTFRKLGCKGKETSKCTQMDATAAGMRCIVNVDRKTEKMNFVLISKKPR
jgi:hypothetical protein